jgi:hypothetical protein
VTREWLLVETLGSEPVVVGQGRQMKNFVPTPQFLRRNPNLAAIQTAIAETVSAGTALARITPKTRREIRTEPVTMTDGVIHGVHVWCGPPDGEPPSRPVPGPLVYDVTEQMCAVTTEYLINAGRDPATETLTGRAIAEEVPSRSLNRDESRALSMSIDAAPGRTYCTTWDFPDKLGTFRRVGWCSRTRMETAADGSEHLIARAMNLLEAVSDSPINPDQLADRIIEGLSQPGVYRVIVDLDTWVALKWIDDPCPYFNWKGRVQMHPEDHEHFATRMKEELDSGLTTAVLRLPDHDGGWVPLHVSIAKVHLDAGVYGGLVSLRLPTGDELADVGLPAG